MAYNNNNNNQYSGYGGNPYGDGENPYGNEGYGQANPYGQSYGDVCFSQLVAKSSVLTPRSSSLSSLRHPLVMENQTTRP
jgi:syntaxin 1B/2/3